MSGHMSSTSFEVPRRSLSGRRPEMVTRLLDAAVTETQAHGFAGLTVRNVARLAGVSVATAYTYFASKEHLLTEVFWRRLSTLPPLECPPSWPLGQRVEAAVEPIALLVADEPELARGVTTAMLAHDPDVTVLRNQIGVLMSKRLGSALGPTFPEAGQLALTMALAGSMLSAGMGVVEYRSVPKLLAGFAELIGEGR